MYLLGVVHTKLLFSKCIPKGISNLIQLRLMECLYQAGMTSNHVHVC